MAEGGYELDEFLDYLDGKTSREPDKEDETSFNLPGPSTDILEPLDGQTLDEYGDRIDKLTGAIRTEELKHQRDRLVNSFYDAIEREYGLRPKKIEFNRFEVDDNGKILYWKVDNKRIRITSEKGKLSFLALGTIANKYGNGGTQAIREYLNLTEYTSKVRRANPKIVSLEKITEEVVQASDADLDPRVDDAILSIHDLVNTSTQTDG